MLTMREKGTFDTPHTVQSTTHQKKGRRARNPGLGRFQRLFGPYLSPPRGGGKDVRHFLLSLLLGLLVRLEFIFVVGYSKNKGIWLDLMMGEGSRGYWGRRGIEEIGIERVVWEDWGTVDCHGFPSLEMMNAGTRDRGIGDFYGTNWQF